MKFVWEESDIKPGRVYSKVGITEQWIIGYVPGLDSKSNRVHISLSDGMVLPPQTAEALAADLTEGGYVPLEYLTTQAQQGAGS